MPDSDIARRMLLTDSEEYQEMRRAYLEDPEGTAQRAVLSLTVALRQAGINWGPYGD
jgi:hypothetical protein